MIENFDFSILKESNSKSYSLMCGVDEVGRGCLAGPVVACTFFLSSDSFLKDAPSIFKTLRGLGVTDSKKLSATKRQVIVKKLGVEIEKIEVGQVHKCEFSNSKIEAGYVVTEVDSTTIDEINILQASLLAMKNSSLSLLKKLEKDKMLSGVILVDGKYIPKMEYWGIDMIPVVQGDSKSVIIGAASIIAKEYRDNLMLRMDKVYPGYGFARHAGYPTKLHKSVIAKQGATPIHRRTFNGVF